MEIYSLFDSSKDGHRVFQLNSGLNRIEMELNHDRHQIESTNEPVLREREEYVDRCARIVIYRSWFCECV